MQFDTLKINGLDGKTIRRTVIQWVLFVGVAEWITRTEFFRTPLTPPKMGLRHYQLGHKLALLEAGFKRNGPINCIIVGSSMAAILFHVFIATGGDFEQPFVYQAV